MNKLGWKNLIVLLFVLFGLTSFEQGSKTLKEGIWRGVFKAGENEIPFLFEVKGKTADNTSIFLINGEDRFQVSNFVSIW